MAEYPVENLSFLEAIESMIGGEASGDTSYVKRVNPRGRANLSTGLRGFLSQLRENPSMLDELLAEKTEARDAPAYEPTHTLGGRGLAESNKARSSQLSKSTAGDLVSQLESLRGALGGTEPEAAVSEEEYEAAAEVPASDYADLERAQRTGTRLGEGKEARAKKEASQLERAQRTGERLGEGDEGRAAADDEEPDFDYDDLVAKRAKKQDRKARKKGRREARGGEVDEVDEADEVDVSGAESLFATVHGGPFDPNSSMDRGKLEQIKANLVRDEFKGLTPNQFALKMYREAS